MIQFQSKPAAPAVIVPCIRSLVDRMSEDMREMAFAGENVNVETLGLRGYTPAVVRRLGPDAVRIASRRSIRRVGA